MAPAAEHRSGVADFRSRLSGLRLVRQLRRAMRPPLRNALPPALAGRGEAVFGQLHGSAWSIPPGNRHDRLVNRPSTGRYAFRATGHTLITMTTAARVQ
jgi:hypothetical protein